MYGPTLCDCGTVATSLTPTLTLSYECHYGSSHLIRHNMAAYIHGLAKQAHNLSHIYTVILSIIMYTVPPCMHVYIACMYVYTPHRHSVDVHV